MKDGLKDKIIKHLTYFALAAIVVGGVVMLVPHMQRNMSLRQENDELQLRIDRKKAEIDKLVDNQRRFQQEADFVEFIARQNNRVFPGEYVFIFEKD